MKFQNGILLAFLFLIIADFAGAQTAEEILDKHFEAIGGLAKFDSIKTQTAEGTSEDNGVKEIIKITTDGDDLWREDVIRHGTKHFILLTKESGWEYDENAHKMLRKLNKSLKKKHYNAANVESTLINYKKPGFQAILLGKDSADGRQCFKLRIKEINRNEAILWFDAETFLKIQSAVPIIASVYNADNKLKDVQVNVVTVFRDYKNVDGMQFPFTCLINAFDVHTNEIVRKISTYFTKMEINKPIDPELYKPK